jgi:hypothetical protein
MALIGPIASRRINSAADKLIYATAIFDGEVVVQDEDGRSDFHALRRIAMLPSRRPISSVIVEAGRCAHAGAHSMDGGGALQRRGY